MHILLRTKLKRILNWSNVVRFNKTALPYFTDHKALRIIRGTVNKLVKF